MKSLFLSSTLGVIMALGTMSCSGKPAAQQQSADPSVNIIERAAEKVEATQEEVASVEKLTSGTISPHATLPVVIDFNATWCGPCVKFGPIFHEVASELKDKALFLSVDVDENPAPAREFGVQSIPQVSILYPDGTVRSTVGYMTKDEFLKFLSL